MCGLAVDFNKYSLCIASLGGPEWAGRHCAACFQVFVAVIVIRLHCKEVFTEWFLCGPAFASSELDGEWAEESGAQWLGWMNMGKYLHSAFLEGLQNLVFSVNYADYAKDTNGLLL